MHVGLIIHNDEWANRKEVKEHKFNQGRHQNGAQRCSTVLLRWPCAEESELLYLSHDLFNRSTAESILSSTSFWFGNSTAVQKLNRIMRTAGEIICVLCYFCRTSTQNCLHKACSILKDPKHPSHGRFTLRKNTEIQKTVQDCHPVSLHKTNSSVYLC